MNPRHSELDAQQYQAANAPIEPIWVTAGPGAGKTKVITERIKNLITKKRIPSNSILALTFTKNAAITMEQRVRSSINRDVHCMTFHAFSRAILTQYGHFIGINRRFDILTNPKGVIRKILKEPPIARFIDSQGFDSKKISNKDIEKFLHILSLAKRNQRNAADFEKWVNGKYANYSNQQKGRISDHPDQQSLSQIAAKLYKRYEAILRQQNKIDFDQLLLNTMKLFNVQKALDIIIRTRKYDHIVVDEFQDTNSIQFSIVERLIHRRFQIFRDYRSIFVVGDHDQHIYGWAGTHSGNLLRQFKSSFPSHRTIQIQTNYRSTREISDVGNWIINQSKDPHREITKKMKSNHGDGGEPVRFEQCKSEEDEAHFVIEQLSALYRKNGELDLDSVAILYRMSSQTRVIEKKLNESYLKYTIAGGDSFYSRKEIAEIVSFLKVVHNKKDDDSIRYLMQSSIPMFRGIGIKLIDGVEHWGKTQEPALSIQQSLFSLTKLQKAIKVPAATNDKIREFLKFLFKLRQITQDSRRTIGELVDELLDGIGYREHLLKVCGDKKGDVTAEDKWQNVQELVKIARDFDEQRAERERRRELERQQNTNVFVDGILDLSVSDDEDEEDLDDDPLTQFLQNIALNTTVDKMSSDQSNNQNASNHPFCQITGSITMSTIHKAKGLEWDTVFLIGCSKGVLPHSKAVGIELIEEERRLAFVAVTRAKRRLFLSYAAWQRNYDSNVSGYGSRTKCSSFFGKGCPMEFYGIKENPQNQHNPSMKQSLKRDNVFKSRDRGMKRKRGRDYRNESVVSRAFATEDDLDRIQGERIRASRAKKVDRLGMGFVSASNYQLSCTQNKRQNQKQFPRKEVENPTKLKKAKEQNRNQSDGHSMQNRKFGDQRMVNGLSMHSRGQMDDGDLRLESSKKRKTQNKAPVPGQLSLNSFFRSKVK